mmetsp:Transcript_75965/g.220620  ORF Transcript_75965/g.220620 Transcript_75965/m.220620 type:complete len:231 (-) Transcript_75965:320-1012(-)
MPPPWRRRLQCRGRRSAIRAVRTTPPSAARRCLLRSTALPRRMRRQPESAPRRGRCCPCANKRKCGNATPWSCRRRSSRVRPGSSARRSISVPRWSLLRKTRARSAWPSRQSSSAVGMLKKRRWRKLDRRRKTRRDRRGRSSSRASAGRNETGRSSRASRRSSCGKPANATTSSIASARTSARASKRSSDALCGYTPWTSRRANSTRRRLSLGWATWSMSWAFSAGVSRG